MALTARHMRLLSGCVLFTYLFSHLVNHALGLWSLAAAEAMLAHAAAFWQTRLMTVVLAAAALTHLVLALRTIYLRRSWHLPLIEIVRLCAGFMLPLLLIRHAVSARVSYEAFGATMSYAQTIRNLIIADAQGWQLGLLAPGWLHGCLGLWLTLRRSATMLRWKHGLIALACLIPLLAAGGFLSMGAELATSGALAQAPATDPALAAARREIATRWQEAITTVYLVAIGCAFAGSLLRNLIERRAG